MSEYSVKIERALEAGKRMGLELKAAREASGKRASDGGMVARMPTVLHDQLVQRFGVNYDQDEGLMKDLRRKHPEMMAADGDVPGDSLDGTRNVYGRVKMRFAKGRWWRPDGHGGWEAFNPPSKMNWGKDSAPAII